MNVPTDGRTESVLHRLALLRSSPKIKTRRERERMRERRGRGGERRG